MPTCSWMVEWQKPCQYGGCGEDELSLFQPFLYNFQPMMPQWGTPSTAAPTFLDPGAVSGGSTPLLASSCLIVLICAWFYFVVKFRLLGQPTVWLVEPGKFKSCNLLRNFKMLWLLVFAWWYLGMFQWALPVCATVGDLDDFKVTAVWHAVLSSRLRSNFVWWFD